uniref:acyltransferase family protein n=1 Tax=Pedobacter schmidteae TaxID=2201271 RepID=UPI000EB39207|nr:DUF5009 domain-containing protein [Pedobacter schmidteae]
MSALSTSSPKNINPKNRLLSLDALRGFDMFWIISGEGIFHGIANVIKDKYALTDDPANLHIIADQQLSITERLMVGIGNQLYHSTWNGFTFYDLIFPLFIFIAGISMAFSYSKTDFQTKAEAQLITRQRYLQLFKRTCLLILLGMVVNGLLKFEGYEQTRFASVLGRIALACFFAAILYLNSSLRWQLAWFSLILVGYWILMTWVPVPHYGAGLLTPEGNLGAYVDQHLLPGKLYRTVYDPEGLLSTIPAIATAMLGMFTGRFLLWKTGKLKPLHKMGILMLAGIVLIALSAAWDITFPINKRLWTSSFVLCAGGWSLLLFAIFYGIIDIGEYKKWCMPLVWIGTNSILIYIAAHGLINFKSTAQFLFGGIIDKVPSSWQQPLIWLGVLGIQLLILRFLYHRKLFLKL